mmetsp:Transcript_8142/g.13668  ORF Transcript_8142/g.13668 Transcript_8142/m.13668 type:complete len:84 (-) Transcript_8142:80-331(-)|eukprot:CAMPEP_0168619010 /NCGR_PEP_ID=MMETSP0449_2-20121227/6377_1 /TAXON_ID=1082188 /ORGANISM="Strombidium rassoulzadegani, Strain ras09" /LENGTH=83 /DNA_ID=CAMNT_0008659923 /DNA_START=32 /DNA_END=283 /DNA_ORIENTATION=+
MSDFETYAQKIRDAKPELSNEQKSEVYGLFKQAKEGDNSVEKPGMLSGFEARGKWDAWEAKKGMSKEEAAAAYVTLVKGILGE